MEHLGLAVDPHVLTQKPIAEKIPRHLAVAVFFCGLHAQQIDVPFFLALFPVVDKPQLNQLGVYGYNSARRFVLQALVGLTAAAIVIIFPVFIVVE